MVRKLLKYEFKYYLRLMVFYLPIIVVIGFATRFIQLFGYFFDVESGLISILPVTQNPLYQLAFGMYYILSTGMMIILIFTSVACLLLTTILGIVRFYKNLYSNDGYLTFTLPVSNNKLLFTKLFTYVVCQLLTAIAVGIAWGVVILTSNNAIQIYMDFIKSIFEYVSLGEFIKAFIKELPEILPNLLHALGYVVEYIILILVSSVVTPLIYYSCISIGQLVNKGRIILSIGVYYGYNWLCQAIGSALYFVFYAFIIFAIFFFPNQFYEFMLRLIANYSQWFMHFILIGGTIVTTAFGVGLYFFNLYIMNKKLNLE